MGGVATPSEEHASRDQKIYPGRWDRACLHTQVTVRQRARRGSLPRRSGPPTLTPTSAWAVFTGEPDAIERRMSGSGTSNGELWRHGRRRRDPLLSPRGTVRIRARKAVHDRTPNGVHAHVQQRVHGLMPMGHQPKHQEMVRLDSRHESRGTRGGTHDSTSQRDVSAGTWVRWNKWVAPYNPHALRAEYQKPATAAPCGHGDARNLRLNVIASMWVVRRSVTLRSLKPCMSASTDIHP